MGIFTEIIGGNLGKLFKEIVGTFKLDPEVKAKMEAAINENEHELKLKEYQLQEALENQITAEIEAKKEIMVAELQQADTFTKRARPSIVYAGLCFIFLNYVFFPILAFFTKESVPSLELPSDFWWVWGGVCGVYMIGRTMEKRGSNGKIVQAITGNKK